MTTKLSPADAAKHASAARALDYVEDGMRLGLGTGSTAAIFVQQLAELAKQEEMKLTCVPTSTRTGDLARSLGLEVTTLDAAGWLDLTIDGADEFDPDFNLIKGGGGALLQEKVVATASDRMLVITDESKQVEALGDYPLPVEVIKFGWETTKAILEETLQRVDVGGQAVTLRMSDDEPYVTDEGHYILDLHLKRIGEPAKLALQLLQIPGVVETGLFIDIADVVSIGYPSGEARLLDLEKGDLGLTMELPQAGA